jgi:hypothetical protein
MLPEWNFIIKAAKESLQKSALYACISSKIRPHSFLATPKNKQKHPLFKDKEEEIFTATGAQVAQG